MADMEKLNNVLKEISGLLQEKNLELSEVTFIAATLIFEASYQAGKTTKEFEVFTKTILGPRYVAYLEAHRIVKDIATDPLFAELVK